MVTFDEGDRLIVFSQDTPLWKSEEKYSVISRYVRKSATGAAAILSKTESESDKSLRQQLPGRIMTLDIGNDGRDEIILPKNRGGAFLSSSKGAELHGLRWTGARLDSVWSIKDLPGPVLDFQLKRQSNGTAQIFVLVKTKGGLFSRDRQQVMIFSLK
jgi:hypothetical protein